MTAPAQWPPVANRYSSVILGVANTIIIPATVTRAWVSMVGVNNSSAAYTQAIIEDLSGTEILVVGTAANTFVSIPLGLIIFDGLQAAAQAASAITLSVMWADLS